MRTVRQLLEAKPAQLHAIAPAAPVIEAIRAMAEHGIGALLVMDGPRLAGIVSERDYARKVILQGRSSRDTPVADIMTVRVVSVSPADTADRCMQVMTEHRIRHLPVLEGDAVVGVLSIGDLVKAVIEQQRQELDHLQRYIAS
ncbi:CBS domain-containing protein [Thermomonas mangrovi]|uniref:CBS domain-containing protein n=1 Tax=Thermomonas mangrovi TaxID=2993316 RepID=UPI002307C6BB|nr:CBS domain-containing protein [Thermomonas mangrovi]